VKAPYPFGFIGDGLTRCAVLALPTAKIRALLPPSLELREQHVTPQGTHPVVLLFHAFSNCQFSFPTFLPPMKFNEQTFGIPFTCMRADVGVPCQPSPFYYMPRLYLDDLWVWMVGRNYWGFDKEMAVMQVSECSYTVASAAGRQRASMVWSSCGEEPRFAMEGYPEFEPIRQMLTQPLISLSPAAVGPFLTLTDFDRNWNLASVRPIRGVLDIDPLYLPGFEGGRFATSGALLESLPALLGAYELSGPWWLSYPYVAHSSTA
jgi:hypothetical protein